MLSPWLKMNIGRSATTYKQSQSELLQLPRELPTQVWELVLTVNKPRVELVWPALADRSNYRPSVLSLLETCRAIRDEAGTIFYATNHLVLRCRGHMHAPRFCQFLTVRQREVIQSITICVMKASFALVILEDLSLLPNLRKLRLERRTRPDSADIENWTMELDRLQAKLENIKALRVFEIHNAKPKLASCLGEEIVARQLESVDRALLKAMRRKNQRNMRLG